MKHLLFALCSLLFLASAAQNASESDGSERLDETIDKLTYDWDLEADKLSSYEGLQTLCLDPEYRENILVLLNQIHHYDSVLYQVLVGLSRTSDDKEIKKTIKDIEKFEEEYDTRSFVHFMSEECKAMREIEKNAEATANDVGSNSYSGQVYLLETELYKYVHHVTKRVDKIREHVHHLSKHYSN